MRTSAKGDKFIVAITKIILRLRVVLRNIYSIFTVDLLRL
jgi:hypothetical protein